MGKPDTVIHVAIAFDQNYTVPFYALATSLIKNHAINSLHIHAITTGINDAEKLTIKEHVDRAGAQISFYEIDFELVRKFVLLNKWTSAAYYKLFFPLLVPETIDRILYLDTDTVVVNNLSTLYAIELGNYPVAAVYDNYVKIQPLLNINTEGEYFNSGVMLIDIQRWKEQKISQRAIDYVINYPERIRFVDQCALNGVLHNNWKRIDEKYNLLYSYIPEYLSRTALTNFLSDKVVVHFTLQRPWNMLCKNRLRHLYHYYLTIGLFAKPKRRYVDFSWNKIPAWITIRIFEFYSDHTLLQKIWRSGKLLSR